MGGALVNLAQGVFLLTLNESLRVAVVLPPRCSGHLKVSLFFGAELMRMIDAG